MGRGPSYGAVEPLDELASETEALLEGYGSFSQSRTGRDAMPARHKLAVGLAVVSLLLGAALVAVERMDPRRTLAKGQGAMRLRSSVLGGAMHAGASSISLEYEVENVYVHRDAARIHYLVLMEYRDVWYDSNERLAYRMIMENSAVSQVRQAYVPVEQVPVAERRQAGGALQGPHLPRPRGTPSASSSAFAFP
jgi:hypothetical protein